MPLRCFLAVLLVVSCCGFEARAGDWPQWRYDARHSACSPDELPATLHLQWVREWGPRQPVWEDSFNQDLLSYDRGFEPVVVGGLAMGKYLIPGTPLSGEHSPEEIRKITATLR